MASTSSGSTRSLSSMRVSASKRSMCQRWLVIIPLRRVRVASRSFLALAPPPAVAAAVSSASTSASVASASSDSCCTSSCTHSRVRSRFFSSAVSVLSRARPSFEYAFVFVSLSTILNVSIRRSIAARASISGCFCFTSEPFCQILIASRYRCSFLISFFSSSSCRSFKACESASWTRSNCSSNAAMPSSTRLRVRSISAANLRAPAILLGGWRQRAPP